MLLFSACTNESSDRLCNLSALETLKLYFNCYQTKNLDLANNISTDKLDKAALENVINIIMRDIYTIDGMEIIDNQKLDLKNRDIKYKDVKIYRVFYYIEYAWNGVTNDGDKDMTYYLYQSKKGNWLIYNSGITEGLPNISD
jgi:hypothetical protein